MALSLALNHPTPLRNCLEPCLGAECCARGLSATYSDMCSGTLRPLRQGSLFNHTKEGLTAEGVITYGIHARCSIRARSAGVGTSAMPTTVAEGDTCIRQPGVNSRSEQEDEGEDRLRPDSRLAGESKKETQGHRVFLQHGIVGRVPWCKYCTEPLPFGYLLELAGLWPGLCIAAYYRVLAVLCIASDDLDPLSQPPRQGLQL